MKPHDHAASQIESEPPPFPQALLIALMCLAALAGALSISTKSFWIDEANAAWRAIQPDWGRFTSTMRELKGSDLQMPFYMGYLWIWEKLVPRTEYWIRFANLPWFILAQAMWLIGFRRDRVLGIAAFLIGLIHPMIWFYMDEARPYAMQYSLSAIVIVALGNVVWNKHAAPGWYACLMGAIALLAGTSMLAMPVAGLAWLAGLWFEWRKKEWKALVLVPGAASLLALGLWTLYYGWTLSIGSGASTAFKTNAATIAFVGYEFLGFSGLGPGRNDLRNGIGALKEYSPALAMLAGALALAGAASLPMIRRSRSGASPILVWLIPVVAVPALLVIGVGFWREFRVLGRHLIFALPLLVLMFAVVVARGAREGRRWVVWAFVPLACLWLGSSLTLRFASRHAKDDYRGAAALAIAALQRGDTVWWVADQPAAEFYGVPVADTASPGKVLSLLNAPSLPAVPAATALTVAMSKPDVYDRPGTVTAFLETKTPESVVTLPSFRISRIPRSPAPER